MSASDINIILNLWAASLAAHDDSPPFSTIADMYNTIDATPLGNLLTYSMMDPKVPAMFRRG